MSLLVESHIRAAVFAELAAHRPALAKKMTRVAEGFFEKIESRLRVRIFNDIREANGGPLKTLRPANETPRQESDWLVNQSSLRDFIQAAIKDTSLVQVAGTYVDFCDHFTRCAIRDYILMLPSTGKTVA